MNYQGFTALSDLHELLQQAVVKQDLEQLNLCIFGIGLLLEDDLTHAVQTELSNLESLDIH